MEFILGQVQSYLLSFFLSGTGRWITLLVLFTVLILSDYIAKMFDGKPLPSEEEKKIALDGIRCSECMKTVFAPLFKVDVRIDEIKGEIDDLEDKIDIMRDYLVEHASSDKAYFASVASQVDAIQNKLNSLKSLSN